MIEKKCIGKYRMSTRKTVSTRRRIIGIILVSKLFQNN